MRQVGAAVVGTGFIGPVHVEAVRRLGHRVVGVVGSSLERSRSAAAALGLEMGYADLAAALADPRVEVVHLASPNVAHFDQCKQVIAAGKHVLCEKPLAMTTAETAELVRLADASGLVTAVAYNCRFYPQVLAARERVRRGNVGDVFHVTGSYLQDWLLEPTDFNWRVLAEHGGELRAVADIGTHWLDLVQFVTGLDVVSVCADLRTVHPTRHRPTGGSETFTNSASGGRKPAEEVTVTTDDYGSVLFKLANGAGGVVTVSQVTAGRKNCIRFDLAGSKEALWWDSEEPNALHVGRRDAVATVPRSMGPFSDYPPGHAEGFPDTFKMLCRAVYADVVSGRSAEPLYATFADGHREVRLCEAVLRSSRERRWVDV